MEALMATIEKLLRQKKEEKYPTTRPGGSINIRCWRYNKIGHFQKDCISERYFNKIRGKDPSEITIITTVEEAVAEIQDIRTK